MRFFKERRKEKELKEKLEHELKEKDFKLQESSAKQVEMEQKLFKLNLMEYQQKQENERLLKVKYNICLVKQVTNETMNDF